MKIDDYNSVCVISPEGDLSGREAVLVRDAIDERLRQRQCVNFVIDLASTRFVDSLGLEALLETRRRCEERSGQLKLANLLDNARMILRLTRLEHRFECHLDLQSALKTMGWDDRVRATTASPDSVSALAGRDVRAGKTSNEPNAAATLGSVRAAA